MGEEEKGEGGGAAPYIHSQLAQSQDEGYKSGVIVLCCHESLR